MTMQTERAYSYLKIEKADGGVAVVTFNRPEDGNRWALADEWEVTQFLHDLAADDEVRAVVLTGSGGTFCGGAHHNDDPFDPFGYYDRSREVFGAWLDFPKPIVVALNGPATGSGLSFMTLCDIVIAERHVTFSDPHVRVGVVTATGPYMWPLSVGLLRAKRWLLTGDTLDAEEAERIGLVSEVVETDSSFDRAMALARQVASYSPTAVQGSKRVLTQWMRQAFTPVFEQGLALEFLTFPAAAMGYGAGGNGSQGGNGGGH